MALLDGHVGYEGAPQCVWLSSGCVIIFGSGYLLAKPHNGADKLFAPLFLYERQLAAVRESTT
jgi:hypothetical protein